MTDVKPDSTLNSPPPPKKLKQARLPFKVIPSKDAQTVQPILASPASGKKRKLSDSASGPSKAPKTPRNDENSPKPKVTPARKVDDAENEVSSSSETDAQVKAKVDEKKTKQEKAKKCGVLDSFVRTTQQPQVSTTNHADSSGIIDLTDSNDGFPAAADPKPDKREEEACSDMSSANGGSKDGAVGPEVREEEVSSDKSSANGGSKKGSVGPEVREEEASSDKSSANGGSKDGAVGPEVREEGREEGEEVQETEKSPVDGAAKPVETLLTSAGESAEEKCEVTAVTSQSKPCSGDGGKRGNDSLLSDVSLDDSLANDTSLDEMASPGSKTSTPSAKNNVKRSATKRPPGAKEAEKQKRKEEMEKAKLQKLKEKEEKEKQKKEEKEKKEREKEEQKKKREQEKKEKLEQKEKERVEKLKQKEEEKRKKEEERLQKVEQKKKEIEEKQRQKEEQEKEKQRLKEEKEKEKQRESEEKNKISNMQKETFKSFFTKKEKTEAAEKVEEASGRFLQFEVKKDMRMAPLRRDGHRSALEELDGFMKSQDCSSTYLKQLKGESYARGKSSRTWPSDEDEIICLEDDQKQSLQKMKVKFLKFHENYRPPYYGTWRKRSRYISARKPLGKDTVMMDYEVDSDDEWEEEEPGESLSDCEKEKEEEEENEEEDEEDDGFFVPHGYLSEGEGCEDDDEEELNPEKLKLRQLEKARRWELEMNAKVAALRSVCIGCLWWNPADEPRTPEYDQLKKFQAVPLHPLPISTVSVATPKHDKSESKKKKMTDANKDRKKTVPEEAIPDLIRLVHGNPWSIHKLLLEFREFWRLKQNDGVAESGANDSLDTSQSELTESELNESQDDTAAAAEHGLAKVQIKKTIREIANYCPGSSGKCWMVHQALLEKHGLTDLPIQNQWKWVTKQPGKKRKTPTPVAAPTPEPTATPVPKEPKENVAQKDGNTPDIKKFAVPGVSPKFLPKEVNETKEIAGSKEASSPSIIKFAKPGISPKFPTISPKPVKMKPQSPFCSTPKSDATPGIRFSADTPKRQATKAITPSSLFTVKSANTSVHSEKEDEDDIAVTKIDPKPDKNQRTLKQMFAKKPPVAKATAEGIGEKGGTASDSAKQAHSAPVAVSGTGTEECPMEID